MKQDFEIKDNEVVIKKDEEPVNDDLMKAAIQAHTELEEGKGLSFINIFIAGANWQKEQMMKVAIDGKVLANGMGNPILHLGDKGRHLIDKKVKVIIVKE